MRRSRSNKTSSRSIQKRGYQLFRNIDFADELRSKYVNKLNELMERLDNAKQFNDILAISQLADRIRSTSIQEYNKKLKIESKRN